MQTFGVFQKIADVAVGMTGRRPHGNQPVAEWKLRTRRYRMRCHIDIRLAVHRRFHKAVFEGLDPADMVVMQMGNPRLRQHQAVADEEY